MVLIPLCYRRQKSLIEKQEYGPNKLIYSKTFVPSLRKYLNISFVTAVLGTSSFLNTFKREDSVVDTL